jgi:hypothetical protein
MAGNSNMAFGESQMNDCRDNWVMKSLSDQDSKKQFFSGSIPHRSPNNVRANAGSCFHIVGVGQLGLLEIICWSGISRDWSASILELFQIFVTVQSADDSAISQSLECIIKPEYFRKERVDPIACGFAKLTKATSN